MNKILNPTDTARAALAAAYTAYMSQTPHTTDSVTRDAAYAAYNAARAAYDAAFAAAEADAAAPKRVPHLPLAPDSLLWAGLVAIGGGDIALTIIGLLDLYAR